jgi:RimJ/RimL family protein N-acetyltransferase
MREPLLTHRLILRDIADADAELLFELDSDPEVMRYIGRSPASDPSWHRDRIRSVHVPLQAHPWHGVRVVLDRATSDFLGFIFIRPANSSMDAPTMGWTLASEEEIGFRYRRSAWGRGIATEAATLLVRIALADPATTAVVACAHSGNAGSLRVLEKLGLARVGEVMFPDATEPTVKLARVK